MLKVQAILQDASVALECLVERAAEAEEMRLQMLAIDGVAEVKILGQPGSCDAASRNAEANV